MARLLFPDSTFGTPLAEITYLLQAGWSRQQVFDYVKSRYHLPDDSIYQLIHQGRDDLYSGAPKFSQIDAERQVLVGAVALLSGVTMTLGTYLVAYGSRTAQTGLLVLMLWGGIMFFRGMYKLT